ncbi:MAG TPA: response regulator [Candidatus Magasanikbacteria bacterium]|nr:response regulator [Candidatus Magasanikbacteria bacterium]
MNLNSKPTILVVEDEESILNAITVSLGDSGFKVITARVADQAWQYLKDVGSVEAIWLDHYLLGEDGIALTKKIKTEEKLKDIPIFVVSNSEDLQKKQEYLSLGVVKYYTKSDNTLEKIITEINDYLKK